MQPNIDGDSAELLHKLTQCQLAAGDFNHARHIQVAWYLTKTHGLLDAVPKFSRLIKAFAQHHGADGLYHETITQFFMSTIGRRIEQTKTDDWSSFQEQNADLFDAKTFLSRHYTKTLLSHPTAREFFLLPDKPAGRYSEGWVSTR